MKPFKPESKIAAAAPYCVQQTDLNLSLFQWIQIYHMEDVYLCTVYSTETNRTSLNPVGGFKQETA